MCGASLGDKRVCLSTCGTLTGDLGLQMIQKQHNKPQRLTHFRVFRARKSSLYTRLLLALCKAWLWDICEKPGSPLCTRGLLLTPRACRAACGTHSQMSSATCWNASSKLSIPPLASMKMLSAVAVASRSINGLTPPLS